MEDNLEQHISKFLLQMLGTALVNGLHSLIGLLQKIAANGGMRLLGIPWAAAGSTEDADDFHQIRYTV